MHKRDYYSRHNQYITIFTPSGKKSVSLVFLVARLVHLLSPVSALAFDHGPPNRYLSLGESDGGTSAWLPASLATSTNCWIRGSNWSVWSWNSWAQLACASGHGAKSFNETLCPLPFCDEHSKTLDLPPVSRLPLHYKITMLAWKPKLTQKHRSWLQQRCAKCFPLGCWWKNARLH